MFRNNVFILGAGFSAGAGAPVMWNFLEQAKQLREDPRLNLPQEDNRAFGRVFKRLGELRVAQSRMLVDIENIENLFSLMDMDIEFGGTVKRALRDDLIFLILRTLERSIRADRLPKGAWPLALKRQEDGGRYQKGINANYVDIFSALASRRWISGPLGISDSGRCRDTIITMNYDCMVDDCLVRMGIQPAYGLVEAQLPTEFNLCKYKIAMLKLHGSANWFKCNSEQCAEKIVIAGGTPSKRLEYFYGQHCPFCRQSTIQPVIVPPTWAKGGQSEILGPVWTEALRTLREAGRIFIIGYSMPSTDEFFRYMLALSLATNELLDKVVVVNPSREAQNIFQKLFQSQFGIRKLKAIESEIQTYVTNNDLASELGQYEHGFDLEMAQSSGFEVS